MTLEELKKLLTRSRETKELYVPVSNDLAEKLIGMIQIAISLALKYEPDNHDLHCALLALEK